MSVTGYTSNWNRNWGPSSQSSWATTAAKFPRRIAADSHAGGIDLQLGRRRRLGHPAHGRHAVVDRRRERMLGRQPIVDGHDRHAAGGREGADGAVMGLEVADDPAAAVEVHEHGPRPRFGGGHIHPHRHVTAAHGTTTRSPTPSRRCCPAR